MPSEVLFVSSIRVPKALRRDRRADAGRVANPCFSGPDVLFSCHCDPSLKSSSSPKGQPLWQSVWPIVLEIYVSILRAGDEWLCHARQRGSLAAFGAVLGAG